MPLVKIKYELPEPHPTERFGAGMAWGFAIRDASSVNAGMARLGQSRPDVYALHAHIIEPNVRRLHGYHAPNTYTIDDFALFELDLTKPVVLWGARGVGKTSFALAHGNHVLVARRLEDLRRTNHETDLIVWENVDFSNMPIFEATALLDRCYGRSVRARHSDIWIEARLKMIFTTPEPPRIVMDNGIEVEHAAIFPSSSNESELRAFRNLYTVVEAEVPMFGYEDEELIF